MSRVVRALDWHSLLTVLRRLLPLCESIDVHCIISSLFKNIVEITTNTVYTEAKVKRMVKIYSAREHSRRYKSLIQYANQKWLDHLSLVKVANFAKETEIACSPLIKDPSKHNMISLLIAELLEKFSSDPQVIMLD